MSALPRLLDANANRAREALRVLEDAARFALNEPDLASDLKHLRHDLRAALAPLPPGWLEANRDVRGDVGCAISTESERDRAGGLADVAAAAGKRLGEALRVLEETAKVFDAGMACTLEALRYRAYEAERRLLLRLGSGRARQWCVCVLLTEALCRRPWEEVLLASLEGGADCIQVREKAMSGGPLAQRTRRVIEVARARGASVIVNDRADVAVAVGADGVHLGQDDLAVADVRRLAGRGLFVGVSTHDMDEAAAAVASGADYCGVGAMFDTALKPQRRPAGPAFLSEFVRTYPLTPHLAIGGVTAGNVGDLAAAGARGVAVSQAVCGADDPRAIVRALCAALEGNTTEAQRTQRRTEKGAGLPGELDQTGGEGML